MSGHSKWSTIKRKKGAQDAKRGKIFTTLIKEITIAARLGGGDEESNPRLRQAIQKAKENNMPQSNIKKAIQRGTGELPGVSYEEATFEGYGPAGVAIMMEVLTDNRNRTVAEIRHIMTKHGGNLGENGSVAWMFDKKGQILLERSTGGEDEILEAALEAGAEDFESEEENYLITTAPGDMETVRNALKDAGYAISSAEVEMVPQNEQKVTGKDIDKILNLMEALDENDDINNVVANFDIDEEELATREN